MIGDAFKRTQRLPFGLLQRDRLHHCYIIGQTGTGKTTLLQRMILQDVTAARGVCLIDPHGDLAETLANRLVDRVIHWRVADPASPYGYNPITRVGAIHRPLVASGLIDSLKKQWADSWGARMEHLLRYALLALLELPEADLRDVVRLYVDREFRRVVIARVTDPQVRRFWTEELPKMNYMTSIDGVAPIANKLGAFLAHPVVRRAVCEPDKPLRFRRIMDRGHILIVNLAKGELGTDNANVLGGLLITNLMNAALTRHDLRERNRRPFFLYVDEFHNFTTSAFAELLPEARKYGLGLTLAHQHRSQMDGSVADAVIGNCGTLLCFRLGATDAALFSRQLIDVPAEALVRLPNYRGFAQLLIQGQKSPAFSFETSAIS
ncbi:type IV secretory system conjugative DNA transfer family protein [Parerythrobacter aestuarii]|uniref:type IV secretory system conjugative DNA transfer family protein n=1 Tax=Parerythrobacter aestuarii TaxID=3020909 RepID=UPI0024DE13E8|nr:type IV secretion system DNA-binding domain-containing protein [Parerythrobacter aestuarii]